MSSLGKSLWQADWFLGWKEQNRQRDHLGCKEENYFKKKKRWRMGVWERWFFFEAIHLEGRTSSPDSKPFTWEQVSLLVSQEDKQKPKRASSML